MEFLGVGPAELMVILVLIMIVVGPRRLPEMAAQLARFIRTFRRYSSRVTAEFNETMGELEKEYEDMQGEWKEVGQGLDETARAVGDELKAADEETKRAIDDARSAAGNSAQRAVEDVRAPVDEPSPPAAPTP